MTSSSTPLGDRLEGALDGSPLPAPLLEWRHTCSLAGVESVPLPDAGREADATGWGASNATGGWTQ